ncbi:MAG TPA: class I SAM-dependent methyltransferase [Pyrinomonadaceae bacterium]|nr:class I SAM-dependent methyltransferase [Pyrinomonadaceae bacterium]
MQSHKSYIPAAGSDWLLPLYDPITKLMGLETARRKLLDQAALRPLSRVLEIGCGTGSFSILIKQIHADVDVIGLDPDPKALARAKRKTERAGVSIQFDRGFSDSLPYDEGTFDYVFSSMMFHHLKIEEKEKTLREVHRVLKPGGLFAMLDLEKPEGNVSTLLGRLFHSNHVLKDNSEDRILTLIAEAGFVNAKTVGHRNLLIGRIAYYQGPRRP